MYSLIQELKRLGTLKLYHDYRSGTFYDFSGNGHQGTPTQFDLRNNHLEATGLLSRVDLTYNANLLLPNGGSLVVLPYRVNPQGNTDVYLNAADGGGNQYSFYYTGPAGGNFLAVQNGTGTARTTAAIYGTNGPTYDQCFGTTFVGGSNPSLYVNGLAQAVTIIGVWPASLYATADTVRIGSNRTLGGSAGAIQAALITSTQLTATQHAQIYGELMS